MNKKGFIEMVKFYNEAYPQEVKQMEKIIKRNDWGAFKKLIKQVLKTSLEEDRGNILEKYLGEARIKDKYLNEEKTVKVTIEIPQYLMRLIEKKMENINKSSVKMGKPKWSIQETIISIFKNAF